MRDPRKRRREGEGEEGEKERDRERGRKRVKEEEEPAPEPELEVVEEQEVMTRLWDTLERNTCIKLLSNVHCKHMNAGEEVYAVQFHQNVGKSGHSLVTQFDSHVVFT